MFNRRWLTAWRLLRSKDFKGLIIRTVAFSRRLVRHSHLPVDYNKWRKDWVDLAEEEKLHIEKFFDSTPSSPSFTLLLPVDTSSNYALVFSTIKSIVSQIYPNWILFVTSENSIEAELSNKILELNESRIQFTEETLHDLGEWIVEIDPGVLLHEAALSSVAACAIERPDVSLIYSDHDHLNESGIYCDPHMKPDWNPDLFNAMNYIGPFAVIKNHLWIEEHYENNDQHDFLSRITENLQEENIFHLAMILASTRIFDDSSHLDLPVERTRYSLPDPEPLVSILVPSRDQGRMLGKCLESIYEATDYQNYEIVLVDHESSEAKARKVIKEFGMKENFRVISFSGSFNFSAMMNQAAEIANGEILVLLNNDTEVIERNWLRELVSQVSRSRIGIVGALLLFSDGTIQHAGIHPGLGGLMGHGHKHLPSENSGYFNRLKAAHEVAAVTGACLTIEKSTWEDLNGLDEENLTVAYNDVDLCFKVRERGLKVIFTPFAKLFHHESVSRGLDQDIVRNERLKKELEVMNKRWGHIIKTDPAYSPNLNFDGGSFTLSNSPSRIVALFKR